MNICKYEIPSKCIHDFPISSSEWNSLEFPWSPRGTCDTFQHLRLQADSLLIMKGHLHREINETGHQQMLCVWVKITWRSCFVMFIYVYGHPSHRNPKILRVCKISCEHKLIIIFQYAHWLISISPWTPLF